MSTTIEKDKIVSSTDLVRSMSKYMDKTLKKHELFIFRRNHPEAVLMAFARYEEMEKELKDLREMLEHMMIYNIVKQREDSEEEEISIEDLEAEYDV